EYPSQAAIVAELKQNPSAILGPPKLEMTARLPSGLVKGEGEAEAVPVDVRVYRANEVRLEVQAPSAGVVVLKDSYFPGWQAWVDGQPSPVLRVDGLVRGVVVPTAGRHEVQVVYRPESFVRGIVLGALTLLLLVLSLAYAVLRNTHSCRTGREVDR